MGNKAVEDNRNERSEGRESMDDEKFKREGGDLLRHLWG